MSNYSYDNKFANKNSLPSGDANKAVNADEFHTEFSNIQDAVNSKADANNSALTGTATIQNASFSGTISDLGIVTTADINGGTIDGTVIGASTAAAGSFTTLSASGGITGTLTGNVTGDVAGDVTGNLTGNVTGNLTGTVLTAAQPNITSVGTLTGFTSTGIDDNATSTALTLSSSGNVGIGTSSPTSRLDVSGDIVLGTTGGGAEGGEISFRGITGVEAASIDVDGSNNLRIFPRLPNVDTAIGTLASTGGNIRLFTDSAERVRISSLGRVGINQTAPDAELHIGNGTQQTEEIILDAAGTGISRITFKRAGGLSPQIIFDNTGDLFYINLGLFQPIQIEHSTGNIRMENLPTSSAGLATGTLWNDSGTVKVA